MQTSPWSRTLELISPSQSVPSIAWPPERITRYTLSDVDEDSPPLSSRSSDDAIIAAVADLGGVVRTFEVAAAVGVSRYIAHVRLERLAQAGRLRREGFDWLVP